MGVGFTGTVSVARTGGAFTTQETKKTTKKWERGTYRAMKLVWPNGGPVVRAVQWLDRKLVCMLADFDGELGYIVRKTKDPKTGAFARLPVPCPTIISAYNFGKVGTDRMDQKVAQYNPCRRWKWPVKIFVHMMTITLNNAHISYLSMGDSLVGPPAKKKNKSFKDFIYNVVDELTVKLGGSYTDPATSTHTPVGHGRRKKDPGGPAAPSRNRAGGRCAAGRLNGCTNRPATVCKECGVQLCIDQEGGKSCWSEFHASRLKNESL